MVCGLLLSGAQAAVAQPGAAATDFPVKGRGIRVVIPFPPGGGNDVLARFLVHGLNEGFAPGSVAESIGIFVKRSRFPPAMDFQSGTPSVQPLFTFADAGSTKRPAP